MEEKPLFSISDTDGIEINLKKGDSIRIHSSQTFMQGVKQNVQGGLLEHHANEELTQVGNVMEATKGGKIVNQGGKVTQINNKMRAGEKGVIINRTYKNIGIAIGVITILGVLADLSSLYMFGVNLWGK
jgi:hypothetical protein